MDDLTSKKKTTKMCPMCGGENLVLLSSMNAKVCLNHDKPFYIDWQLDEGQISLVSSSRASRRRKLKNMVDSVVLV